MSQPLGISLIPTEAKPVVLGRPAEGTAEAGKRERVCATRFSTAPQLIFLSNALFKPCFCGRVGGLCGSFCFHFLGGLIRMAVG